MWKIGARYKHERMIAASFIVERIRYQGPEYCKLQIRWITHDGKCDSGIVERNKKVMNCDFKFYTCVG